MNNLLNKYLMMRLVHLPSVIVTSRAAASRLLATIVLVAAISTLTHYSFVILILVLTASGAARMTIMAIYD